MTLPRGMLWILALIISTVVTTVLADDAVDEVASGRLTVSVGNQTGQLALYSEGDLTSPHPGIVRAIVVFHGLHRNAAGYLRDLEESRAKAGNPGKKSFLIAPQFLDEDDARAHKLPENVLRWHRNQWEAGDPAAGPSPISSYDAIDSILTRLSDRGNFPDLREIVLAGHSGGGQIVQRYSVVGHQIAAAENAGLELHFVVANPSSYVYFDDYRPESAVVQGCSGFNQWKYGFRGAPQYIASDVAALEAAYVARHVTYLLGTADDDPNGPDIDKNCAAEAQGPTRLRRGANYFKYLQSRHQAALEHRVLLVPGVAHDAKKMFTSVCGIDALFQTGACAAARFQ
jgi:pimeloyl-ACP methyl ester carboxylesterase